MKIRYGFCSPGTIYYIKKVYRYGTRSLQYVQRTRQRRRKLFKEFISLVYTRLRIIWNLPNKKETRENRIKPLEIESFLAEIEFHRREGKKAFKVCFRRWNSKRRRRRRPFVIIVRLFGVIAVKALEFEHNVFNFYTFVLVVYIGKYTRPRDETGRFFPHYRPN